MDPINIEFEFTYDEYLGMCASDREQIYYALYAWMNNEAIGLEISMREVFDHIMAKTIRDQAYEFSTILRDFRNFFEDDF